MNSLYPFVASLSGKLPQIGNQVLRHARAATVFCALVFLLMSSCSVYNPASPGFGKASFLPAPTDLGLKVGIVYVDLSWRFGDMGQVQEFRIYRKEQAEDTFRRIASTKALQYRDAQVSSNKVYAYRVAAVNAASLEGKPSESVTVTPFVYGLKLAGGAQYTNRRSVFIELTAPSNTELMILANDSSFSKANWESFTAAKFWDLTPGDGKKIVYVKFRGADGQEFSRPVKAEIILDTVANIKSVQENSGGRNLKVGEKLHIGLEAGEALGTATADIVDPAGGTSNRELNIRLYDDGTSGDQNAGDGVYETDYTVRFGLEVFKAVVYGHFTDAAGNVAATTTATSQVTIQLPPNAVTLYEPATQDNDITSLSLRWSRNSDADFLSYQLRRARNSNVSLSSVLVKELNGAQNTSYVDSNLEPGTQYFYRLYVFDNAGNSSGSNTVQATTPPNAAPKPVVLSQPAPDAGALALTLTWSSSSESDFASYRLYRSTVSPVDNAASPIVVINSAVTTQYRDTNVLANTTYYYRVFIFDKYGLSAGSNEVQGSVKLP